MAGYDVSQAEDGIKIQALALQLQPDLLMFGFRPATDCSPLASPLWEKTTKSLFLHSALITQHSSLSTVSVKIANFGFHVIFYN
ncbi:hypothetical protein [Nostoc sp.]|uniref:hypothetical protein n=1 Tax=Nostoc sp. TaxID=1180 RepID=UPI002FFD3A23